MRGGGKVLTASEAWSGRRGERRRGGFTAGVGRCGGEDRADNSFQIKFNFLNFIEIYLYANKL
jgi:hypothetical protein